MAIQHVFSNAVADGTNTNIVRPSDWNSFHNQLSTISGNTLGGSTLSGTNIVLAGGSNITLSATGNTISIIGNSGGGGGGGGVAVSAGTDSLFTSGTVVFGNTLNGTFATSNGSVIYSNNFLTTAMASNRGSDFVQATASFAGTSVSGTIGSSGISISVGPYITTAAQSNQVVNSVNARTGEVSFAVGSSLSSSTNGSSTTFGLASNLSTAFQTTGNYLTTAMASNRGSDFVQATAAFAGTNASGTIGSNGVSVSVGNYLTTAMASNRGSDFVQATAAFAGTNASGTIGSNGISISVAAPGTGGGGGVAVSAGTASLFTSGTVVFGNTLNGTFATSNGSVIYSNNFLTTAAQSNQVVNSVNGSTGQISFNVGSSLSSSTNGSSITFGLASNLSTAFQTTGNYLTSQSNPAFSAAGGSSAFQTLSFSDNAYGSWTNTGGAVALTELRGSFFAAGNTLTAQNSSGTQNIDAVSFAGSGAISVGVSNGSVVISAPATVAGAAPTVSFAANLPAVNSVATVPVFTNATNTQPSIAAPFAIPNNISFDFVRGINSVAFNLSIGSTVSIATTYRAGLTATHNVHVYSFGTGTNSTVLQYVASTSASLVSSINVNISSSSYSVSQGVTYPVSNGTSTFSVSYSAATTTYTVSTNALTAFNGVKFLDIPFGTSLSAGNYVFLYGVNNSVSTSGSNMTGAQIVNQPLGLPQVTNVVGRFGVANAASIQLQSVVGSFSTAGGATTASIPLSAVSSLASHIIRYLTLQRQA